MTKTRLSGLYAMLAAAAAVASRPLLALSYFGIDEGSDELSIGTVSGVGAIRHATSRAGCSPGPRPSASTRPTSSCSRCCSPQSCCALCDDARPAPGGERSPRAVGLADRASRVMRLATAGLVAAFVVLVRRLARRARPSTCVFLALLMPGMLLGVFGSSTCSASRSFVTATRPG